MSNKISQSLNKADGMDRDNSKMLSWSMDPFSSSLSEPSLSRKLIIQPYMCSENGWYTVAGGRI